MPASHDYFRSKGDHECQSLNDADKLVYVPVASSLGLPSGWFLLSSLCPGADHIV